MVDIVSGSEVLPASDRSYVDLGAVIAGTVVAVGGSIILTTFAAALGMGSISFGPDGGISTTGLILTALVSVVAMVIVYMLGGYITGRLRRRVEVVNTDEVHVRDGLHGLVVWGLGMILSAFVLVGALTGGVKAVGDVAGTALEAAGSAAGGVAQGAGQLAGGALSGVGGALGGAAQGVGNAVAPTLEQSMPQGLRSNPMDYIMNTLLRGNPSGMPSGPDQTANTKTQVSGILLNLVTTGEISDDDKAYLKTVTAAQTGLSPTEVDARVNQAVDRATQIRATAQKKVDDAKAQIEQANADAQKALDEAKAKAEKAAEEARVASILSAFLLAASAIVAAAAAYIGAVRGGQHRDDGRIWGGLAYRRR